MKIAFIVECFPRVSETFILDQITGFLDLGHEVVILSFWTPDRAQPVHDDVNRYQLPERTEYLHYTPGPWRGRMQRWLYGARHLPAALMRRARKASPAIPLRLLLGRHLQKVIPLVRHTVDVIYCQFGTTAKEFAFLAPHLDVPWVVAFWGYDVELLPEEKPGVYDDVFTAFDLCCTPSQYLAEKLLRLGCPRERLLIQRIGLKTAHMLESPPKREQSPIKLLSVGRLVPEKGFHLSIEAVCRLRGSFVYRIIGDGPERSKLEELIRQARLTDRVTLVGAQPREQVFRSMAESDIYVCPSLRESYGVANLEASYFRLPVIASRVGGVPEIVHHGVTGWLVPPGDVAALAAHIQQLMDEPQLRYQMGNAGHDRVLSQLNQEQLMKHLEAHFLRLINRPARG
ncbi:MAG: glycosyltransferase [Acidobacteriota bacterium]|nr:glycosyltransferase [Blastocatellia bacterium]MDW8239417.1 glycosyltransferase [Acidobacteriota bacterium]